MSSKSVIDRKFVIAEILRDISKVDVSADDDARSVLDAVLKTVSDNTAKYETMKNVSSFKLKRCSAWDIYSRDYINEHKDEVIAKSETNDFSIYGEIRKSAGAAWKVLDEETKDEYKKRAELVREANFNDWFSYYESQTPVEVADVIHSKNDLSSKQPTAKILHLCGLLCRDQVSASMTKKEMLSLLNAVMNNATTNDDANDANDETDECETDE